MLAEEAVIVCGNLPLADIQAKSVAKGFVKDVLNTVERHAIDLEECSYRVIDNICHVIGAYKVRLYRGIVEVAIRVQLNILFYAGKVIAIHLLGRDTPFTKYLVQSGAKTNVIPEEGIVFIESIHNDVYWHCENGIYKERGTIGKKSDILSNCFTRVRQSHFVNLNHVQSIEPYKLTVSSKEAITIPKSRYKDIKAAVESWNLVNSAIDRSPF